MGHYIKICIYCGDVTSQCRCPDKNKPITDDVCEKCTEEMKDHVLKELKTKTLIGTCGDCCYWMGDGANHFAKCLKRIPEAWAFDDGCIKWKEKQND